MSVQGLDFKALMFEGVLWWNRLYRLYLQRSLGRREVLLLHRTSSGRVGGLRGPDEGALRPKGALDPPVSLQDGNGIGDNIY